MKSVDNACEQPGYTRFVKFEKTNKGHVYLNLDI